MAKDLALFEQERPALLSMSYRMLGEHSAAEDVVQEVWVRFDATEPNAIQNPKAWLRRVATNIAIDTLRSAQSRRESYVGPWLPEPYISDVAPSPLEGVELAQECELALLWAMERLAPTERAAFILREAFDAEYAEIASTLNKSEAACRQLVSRAHKRLQSSGARFDVSQEEASKALETFFFAATQDHAQAMALLAQDALAVTDGGGKASAAFRTLHGPAEIIQVMKAVLEKEKNLTGVEFKPVLANGRPAMARFVAGSLDTLTYVLPDTSGAIQWIYVLRNPEKMYRMTGMRQIV